MEDARQREIAAIRLIQQDLRKKLEAVDERLERLEGLKYAAPSEEAAPMSAREGTVSSVEEASEFDQEPVKEEKPEPVFVEQEAPRQEAFRPPPLPPFPRASHPGGEPRQDVRKPTSAEPMESFEVRLGRVWLVRVGILILLTGLVFLGNLAWHEVISRFGPAGKLALIFLAGGGLCGFGWWVGRKKKSLAGYGRVVLGGGLATLYYACYAAHFVEPLRVITSPLAGGVLLLVFSAGLLWLSNRLKSQTVASATILLGFYTASINPMAGFSLFGNLLLTLVAVALFLRRKWVSVSYLTLLGCYLSFAFWRFHATGSLGWIRVEPGWAFWNAFLFPAAYWVIFSVATFAARPPDFPRAGRPVFLTLNNGAFFGLTAPLVAGTYPGSLWVFSLAFGMVLVAMSLAAARLEPDDNVFDGTYLTQGLGLLMLAAVFRLSGYQLAIMLALQSSACMGLSRLRHPVLFQLFSGLAGLLAVFWSLGGLAGKTAHAAFTAGAVSLILLGVAWMFKKQRGLLSQPGLSWRASGFVAPATLLMLWLVLDQFHGVAAVYALIALAVVLAFLPLAVRLHELSLAGQFLVIAAFSGWMLIPSQDRAGVVPWLAVLVGAVTVLHWWQWNPHQVLSLPVTRVMQSLNAGVAVAVTLAWQLGRFDGAWLGLSVACAAVGFLVYGLLTQAAPLGIVGQANSLLLMFLLPVAFLGKDPWPLTLGSTALFAIQPLILDWFRPRIPGSLQAFAGRYQVLLRSVAVLMGLLATHAYIPSEWRFAALAVAAALLMIRAACSDRVREYLIYAAVWAGGGYLAFILTQIDGDSPHPASFLGFFLMLAAAAAARRFSSQLAGFSAPERSAVVVLAIAGTWWLVGRFVAAAQGGILLTISWSVLAFAVLAAGFLLKERTYRLSGLVILTASVGRIFLVDVWQLETLPRILSFLVLGIVLLALGFLYNRFADAIRRWL